MLWVNSVRCLDYECRQHVKYDYKSSSNWSPIKESKLYTTLFGSGELTGVLSQDWIHLEGITVKNYEFAEIVSQKSILDDVYYN